MAHYAQIDANNVVTQVVVIDNKDTADFIKCEIKLERVH